MANLYEELSKVNSIKILHYNTLTPPYLIRFKVRNEDVQKWNYWYYKVRMLSKENNIPTVISMNRTVIKILCSKDATKAEKELHIIEEALKKKYYLIEKPKFDKLTFIVKVTNLCNLNCKYCYDVTFREKLGHNGIMPLSSVEKIIDVASKSTQKLVLIFHGGEPSLAGIDYYKSVVNEILPNYPYLEMEVSMQTNGTKLNSEWYSFSRSNHFEIGLSNNLMYEHLRGLEKFSTNGNNIVIEKAKKAKIAGCSDVGCIEVINSENIKDLKNIYEEYKKNKVGCCFNFVFEAGNVISDTKQMITLENYKEYIKPYFKYWLYDKTPINDRFAHRYFSKILNADEAVCIDGSCDYKFIGINSNGDLYPCDRPLSETYRIGNIMEYETVEEMFNSEAYTLYISELSQGRRKYCAKCDIENYCHSDCPMKKYDANGNFKMPNLAECEVQKFLLQTVYELLCEVEDFNLLNPIIKSIITRKNRLLPYEIKEVIDILKPDNKINYRNNFKGFNSEEFYLFKKMNNIVGGDICATTIERYSPSAERIDFIIETIKSKQVNYE